VVWSPHNTILQSWVIALLLQGTLVLALGWATLAFLLVHNLVAWFQLTSANYVEHYGLLRRKRADGAYERCQPHHSWNSNHIFSNLLLFHLERHSDHPIRRDATSRCVISMTCLNFRPAISGCSCLPIFHRCGLG